MKKIGRPCAITAEVDVRAHAALEVVGGVLLARGVGDTVLVGVLIDATWVSTIARTTGLAVDDDLGVKADWGRLLVCSLVEDVESVGNG